MTPPTRVEVVGLGPAGPELMTAGTRALLAGGHPVVLRTARHPSAAEFAGPATTCDDLYESLPTFGDVYRAVVDRVVGEAVRHGTVVYGVPGSPMVAEATVALLRRDPRVTGGDVAVTVHPALSFLDLAYVALDVDPLDAGVRLVDGGSFAAGAAGERGPLLVAQCWSRDVLSEIKLSVDPSPEAPVTVLHHLGLPDERVFPLAWSELDRTFEPDHLTSLWIPAVAAPIGAEMVRLDELVRTLREQCPWDRVQTHGSLSRHLLEESYEALEAIDAVAAVDAALEGVGADGVGRPGGTGGATGAGVGEEQAVAHLEEELGDLLFQVFFHAALAAEAGRFTVADVARGVHDKLVYRHPHVFADGSAVTADDVAANWEVLKQAEKGRSRVTDGIPAALPALALAAKLQRKGIAVGLELPDGPAEAAAVAEGVVVVAAADAGDPSSGVADGEGGSEQASAAIGDLLFRLVGVARRLGVDPETALRNRAAAFRAEVDGHG